MPTRRHHTRQRQSPEHILKVPPTSFLQGTLLYDVQDAYLTAAPRRLSEPRALTSHRSAADRLPRESLPRKPDLDENDSSFRG